MTQKERLVDMLFQGLLNAQDTTKDVMANTIEIADYLLSNGVVVPPCKVGDMVYAIVDSFCGMESTLDCSGICSGCVHSKRVVAPVAIHSTDDLFFVLANMQQNFYITRELAERALKECEKHE